MNIERLRQYLDDSYAAAVWLCGLGIVDVRRAHGNLLGMATAGVPLDLLATMCSQLERHLPGCADPDMALHNLERFVAGSRNPLSIGTLFERDPQALPTLLQIFASSQYLSDLLVFDPEGFDLLRLTEGQPVARPALVDELVAEIAALEHDTLVLRALRRFKRRETLRIAYGDIIREQSLRTVTTQISFVADAILEAALRAARRKFQAQRGVPLGPDGRPARFVVLGMGKLGGLELNYSSDIDLILLCEDEGHTEGPRPLSNREFFDLVARDLVRLLTERTELGRAYRVDLRLRPEGQRGPVVMDVQSALAYYDNRGRTWERQAYIKARPVAGDLSLGTEFLESLTPWIYRRYLSHADISGIKALKRRIEQQTLGSHERTGVTAASPRAMAEEAAPVDAPAPVFSRGGGARDVKTGRGGIRDIEFVIQFLQLLNGGDLPALRTANTLDALEQLARVGCLTSQERAILEENYAFLRKIEHRLQIMLDLQTHLLPENRDELRKLALRMGYATTDEQSALDAFLNDYRAKTELNRKILDHLLHDAFSDDTQTRAEVDLVLDPDPPEERIAAVLGKYPFRDVKQAYRNLMSLAEERIRFLSTRRCRHFLAAIAPQLLAAIATTADPDSTLVNLDQVSDSLGGKGVLWELFSFNPPSLRLYVELCAYSPHLSGILTSNPGMIDSLMDSLVLDKLPTLQNMRQTLAELCRAAEDIDPILHSFKNDQQLCVGVRDILAKEDIQATTGALSDIAEACLSQIAAREYERLTARFGQPLVTEGRRGAALRNGRAGAGQVRRPRNELPQRPGRHLPLRSRRPDGGRRRSRAAKHHQPAFFRRTRAANHQKHQPPEQLRPALRSRRAAASDGQERHVGHHLRGVRPLLRHRRRTALGAAGAVQGAGGVRLAAGRKTRHGRRGQGRFRPPLAAQRCRRRPPHAAPPGGCRAYGGRPETRPRRHRRHRVSGADAATEALPRQPGPSPAQHLGGPRRTVSCRVALGRRLRTVRRQLPAAADDRKPAAADELDGARSASSRSRRADEAGEPLALSQQRRPADRLRERHAANSLPLRSHFRRGLTSIRRGAEQVRHPVPETSPAATVQVGLSSLFCAGGICFQAVRLSGTECLTSLTV